jgi:hypothetical protein
MKITKSSIEFFDMSINGGHGLFLAKLFGNKLSYLRIDICEWRWATTNDYYDGFHFAYYGGFVVLSYGY